MLNFTHEKSLYYLRISLGIIFLWFGFLKFFPNASPAEELAGRTINALSFGVVSPAQANFVLAIWESLIGIGFLTGRYLKQTIYLMFLQMAGTFTPLFLFPNEMFANFPFIPTFEGQYIVKNLVLISGALVLLSKPQRK